MKGKFSWLWKRCLYGKAVMSPQVTITHVQVVVSWLTAYHTSFMSALDFFFFFFKETEIWNLKISRKTELLWRFYRVLLNFFTVSEWPVIESALATSTMIRVGTVIIISNK